MALHPLCLCQLVNILEVQPAKPRQRIFAHDNGLHNLRHSVPLGPLREANLPKSAVTQPLMLFIFNYSLIQSHTHSLFTCIYKRMRYELPHHSQEHRCFVHQCQQQQSKKEVEFCQLSSCGGQCGIDLSSRSVDL